MLRWGVDKGVDEKVRGCESVGVVGTNVVERYG